jgi:large subunit ribosomal protein L17
MRHQKSINHLGRTSTHRKAMLSNMASSLIKHKRISTTIAKAKALRGYVEPLITRAKIDSTHSRRVVFSYLQDKDAVTELFRDISVKVADRPGGYVRILKTGFRLGDNADMCIIELVDYNENLLTVKDSTAKKATRRRKPAAKKATDAPETVVAEKAPIAEVKTVEVVEEVVETPVDEETKDNEAETK